MLDAVDPGLHEIAQRVLGEAVRGDPGTEPVRLGDRRLHLPARPAGGQVPGVPVDPVADELDPAVAVPGLPGDVLDEVPRLDLMGVVPDVAAGARDVAARPDDLREVGAGVDPPGVGGRPRVPQQQRPGLPLAERLLLGGGFVDRPARVEPDVAVRVDQTGQRPPPHRDGLRGRAYVGDPPPDHPQLVPDVVGPDQHPPLHMQHRVIAHAASLTTVRRRAGGASEPAQYHRTGSPNELAKRAPQ